MRPGIDQIRRLHDLNPAHDPQIPEVYHVPESCTKTAGKALASMALLVCEEDRQRAVAGLRAAIEHLGG